ncbi:hypothetical protein HYALB_00011539 [Hymenoscyphus albidus]|uniref:Uncharacterized protein n=1 Tax=Hymenoscyphus albidus TaxID=595503 RepID=A0A9N9LPC0_9HELO|nr:hypothetical protein HYALB_00011539 [Hymenoscyphus albidus]
MEMESNTPLELGVSLSFPSMLLYLASYFIIERVIKHTFIRFFPQTYSGLHKDRKDIRYFAFVMGILITIFSTPICYKALQESKPRNDKLGSPNYSKAGEICIASRGVLWISELNRLDYSWVYITHHISSISYLVYHIQTNQPLRLIHAFYTSLLTELISDISALLTIHDFRTATSSLAYRFQTTNTILLVFLRLPPIWYAAKFIATLSTRTSLFWIDSICLLIYFLFITHLIFSASRRLNLFQLESKAPAYILITQRFKLSIYSIFFAIASFVTAIISAVIYIQSSTPLLSASEIKHLSLQLMGSGAAAYVGARASSHIIGRSLTPLNRKILFKASLWIQGSFFAVILSICVSPLVGRMRFISSFFMAFPIGECLGRIGCYFAGCCGEKKYWGTPAPLLSSMLNGIVGVSVLKLWARGGLDLEWGAGMALCLNAMIRILLRPNLFSFGQLVAGAVFVIIGTKLVTVVPSNSGTLVNRTGEDFALHEKNTVIKGEFLGSEWIVLLALGSVLAGSLVQGPTGEDFTAEAIRACNTAGEKSLWEKDESRNLNGVE